MSPASAAPATRRGHGGTTLFGTCAGIADVLQIFGALTEAEAPRLYEKLYRGAVRSHKHTFRPTTRLYKEETLMAEVAPRGWAKSVACQLKALMDAVGETDTVIRDALRGQNPASPELVGFASRFGHAQDSSYTCCWTALRRCTGGGRPSSHSRHCRDRHRFRRHRDVASGAYSVSTLLQHAPLPSEQNLARKSQRMDLTAGSPTMPGIARARSSRTAHRAAT